MKTLIELWNAPGVFSVVHPPIGKDVVKKMGWLLQFVVFMHEVCWICGDYGKMEFVRCMNCASPACKQHLYIDKWLQQHNDDEVCSQ